MLLKSDTDADKVLEDKHFSECDRHSDANESTPKSLKHGDIKPKVINHNIDYYLGLMTFQFCLQLLRALQSFSDSGSIRLQIRLKTMLKQSKEGHNHISDKTTDSRILIDLSFYIFQTLQKLFPSWVFPQA